MKTIASTIPRNVGAMLSRRAIHQEFDKGSRKGMMTMAEFKPFTMEFKTFGQ